MGLEPAPPNQELGRGGAQGGGPTGVPDPRSWVTPELAVREHDRYLSGEYLIETGGTWHLEDAPFKAGQVVKMLQRAGLKPGTICDIGCGAGGVLARLVDEFPSSRTLVGYEISPDAIELCKRRVAPRVEFRCGDAFTDDEKFDLVLVLDVVEHVEDCFAFLRKARLKGEYKCYHIPLEISVLLSFREGRVLESWRKVGHIHRFSVATALEALRYTGHEIVDHFLTPAAFATRRMHFRTRLANVPRRVIGFFSDGYAQRLLGGYSLMVLAK